MSQSLNMVVVVTTLNDEQDAKTLADVVVGKRLAACVQWYPIQSVYRWRDDIEHDHEILLQAKTTSAAVTALQQCIRDHHPYETPEIIVLPIIAGHPDYLTWIRDNVKPPALTSEP